MINNLILSAISYVIAAVFVIAAFALIAIPAPVTLTIGLWAGSMFCLANAVAAAVVGTMGYRDALVELFTNGQSD